jgi:hypothetical protein
MSSIHTCCITQNPFLSGRVRSTTCAIQEMRALIPAFSFVGIPHKLSSVTIFLAPAEAPFKNRPHLADALAAVRAQIAGSPAHLPSDKSDSFSLGLVRRLPARPWVPIERALLAWPVHSGGRVQKRHDDQWATPLGAIMCDAFMRTGVWPS